MPLGPPLLRLRSTLFLVGLCLFSAGLLCSLVQRHQRLTTLIHTRSLLSQIEGDLPTTGTLSQLQWQRQLASLAAGGPFDRSTSEAAAFAPQAASVEQLVKSDRRSLIQAAQRLIKQAELEPALEVDTSHLTPAAETGVTKMMSSRNVGLGGGITSSLRNLWSSYNRALLLRPLATKIATGVVGTIIGDGVAQYSGYRMALPSPNTAAGRSPKHHQPPPFQYDFARLARLLAWSALFATPMAHYWFQFLDTRIMPSAPTSMRAVAAKLLLDQGFMAPFGTSLFFMSMKVMEGQPDKAIPEVRSKLWPVMLANWTVWPLANAINFALIPPSQRILYVNVLAVAWSAFMSHMANKPAAPAVAAPHHAPAHAHVHSHKHGALAMHALEPASSGKMS